MQNVRVAVIVVVIIIMSVKKIGMYRISVFQIRPDLAGFMTTNPTGAGAGARFQNLVQRKTTPELQWVK